MAAFAALALIGVLIAAAINQVSQGLGKADHRSEPARELSAGTPVGRSSLHRDTPAWIPQHRPQHVLTPYNLVRLLREQQSFLTRTEDVFFKVVFGEEPWTRRLERQYATDQPVLRRGLAECYATGSTRDLRSVVSILQKFSLTQTITDIAADYLYPEFVAFDSRPLDEAYTYLVLDLWSGPPTAGPERSSGNIWYAFGYSGISVELIARQPMPQNADEWRMALLKIRDRGVRRVSVVASDAHPDIGPIIQSVFPGSMWMPCYNQFLVLPDKFMPTGSGLSCVAEYCTIVANTDSQNTAPRLAEWRGKWKPKCSRLCDWLLSKKGDG